MCIGSSLGEGDMFPPPLVGTETSQWSYSGLCLPFCQCKVESPCVRPEGLTQGSGYNTNTD